MSDTALTFPCDFPIKVMGLANLEFQGIVLGIINKHVPDLAEGAIETRYSKDKKYIAMTITIHATNKEQIDDIYRELSSNKAVIMAL